MTGDIASKLVRTAEYICIALAAFFTLSFIGVAFSCLSYPFNLEWMEGQTIDVVQRVRDGLPLYTAPSLDYVPFIYTPYYFYVVAFVSLFTGVDFFPARLVSTLSALGIGAILYAWVCKEGGSRAASFIGVGLFFATYRLSGRWFDDSRIDSLFLLLTMAGLFVFYHYRGLQYAFLAALLFALAFFTKQTALTIAAPVFLAGLFLAPRHTIITGGMLAVMLGAGIFSFNAASDGWFDFYVFTVPQGQAFDDRVIEHFWRRDILRPLFILFPLGIGVIALWFRQDRKKAMAYLALAVGCIGTAYISRYHMYGYANVLMPAHVCVALLAGLGFKLAHEKNAAVVFIPLLIVQMLDMVYNPLSLIPTRQSIVQGNKFLDRIARIDGDVFMPDLQFVETRVGKKSYAFGMAAFDLLRSELGEKNFIKEDLDRQLRAAISDKQFAAIVPGHFIFDDLPGLRQSYAFSQTVAYPKEMVAGAVNYYRMNLYLPKPDRNNPFDKPPGGADDSPTANPEQP